MSKNILLRTFSNPTTQNKNSTTKIVLSHRLRFFGENTFYIEILTCVKISLVKKVGKRELIIFISSSVIISLLLSLDQLMMMVKDVFIMLLPFNSTRTFVEDMTKDAFYRES